MNPDDVRHGTDRGYQAHHKAGEQPCDPCRAAHAADGRTRRRTPRPMVSALGTHRRVQALRAIGWSGAAISRECGRSQFWVQQILLQDRVHQGTAELIACTYERLSMTVIDTPRGRRTAAEARALGWLPPLAWDDIDDAEERPGLAAGDDCDYDDAVVERVLGGEWNLPSTHAERTEIVRRWYARGGSSYALEAISGWKTERYYRMGTGVAA